MRPGLLARGLLHLPHNLLKLKCSCTSEVGQGLVVAAVVVVTATANPAAHCLKWSCNFPCRDTICKDEDPARGIGTCVNSSDCHMQKFLTE